MLLENIYKYVSCHGEMGEQTWLSLDLSTSKTEWELNKKEYFAFYGHPQFLTLEQGQFAIERKLSEIDFILSPTQPDTPKDGDCMFHALLDQLDYNPDLKEDVSDVQELRWKCVHFGYTFYLKSGKISVSEGTPEDWKKKMSRSGECHCQQCLQC